LKYSAGILINIHHNGELKYLVCHPTKASWYGRHDLPKGGYLLQEETPEEAALRETKEEVGLDLSKEDLKDPEIVNYISNKGKIYKKVTVFKVHINIEDYKEYFTTNLTVKKEFLQLEEVDWAGFLNLKELEKRLFRRFKKLLGE